MNQEIIGDDKVYHANDRLFKAFMADEKNAKDFFAMQLPDEILSITNTSKLELSTQSFVNECLRQRHEQEE